MKLVIASNNAHKIAEISAMLTPLGYEAVSQRQAGITVEPEENGGTFEDNARIKARAVHGLCGAAVLADDSGLEVDALGGAPGVYSHRYAGDNATDDDRIAKLLREMGDVPTEKRGARFVCAMCFIDESGSEITLRGECSGRIGFERTGSNGFGYDPVFYIADGRSFAELSADEKNAMSHRHNALEKLVQKLK